VGLRKEYTRKCIGAVTCGRQCALCCTVHLILNITTAISIDTPSILASSLLVLPLVNKTTFCLSLRCLLVVLPRVTLHSLLLSASP